MSSICKNPINKGRFLSRVHPSLTHSLVTRTRQTINPTTDSNNIKAHPLNSKEETLNVPMKFLLHKSAVNELLLMIENLKQNQNLKERLCIVHQRPLHKSPTYIIPKETFLKTILGKDLERLFSLENLNCFLRISNQVTTTHLDSPSSIHMAINLSLEKFELNFPTESLNANFIDGLHFSEGVLFLGGTHSHHVNESVHKVTRILLYFENEKWKKPLSFDPSNFSSGVFEQRLQEKGDLLTTFLSYPSLFARIQLTAETRDNLKHALDSESCSYESRKAIAFAEHTSSVPSILVNPYSSLGKSLLIADTPILTWMRRPRHCHPIPSHHDQKGLISFIYNLEDYESVFLNLDGKRLEILPYEGIAFHASTYHGLDLNPKSKTLGHRLIGYTHLKHFIELSKHTLENFTRPWMALQLYELQKKDNNGHALTLNTPV